MANGKRGRFGQTRKTDAEAAFIFRKREHSTGYPWFRVDRDLLTALLDCATANGAALMFGATQGGRGIVITVFANDARDKAYAGTEEEFADIAIEVIEFLQGPSQDYLALYGINSAGEVASDD